MKTGSRRDRYLHVHVDNIIVHNHQKVDVRITNE